MNWKGRDHKSVFSLQASRAMFRPNEQYYQHLEVQTFAMDAVNEWDFWLFPPGEDECMGKTKKESELVPEAKTRTETGQLFTN